MKKLKILSKMLSLKIKLEKDMYSMIVCKMSLYGFYVYIVNIYKLWE